jgi:hypothetical protein
MDCVGLRPALSCDSLASELGRWIATRISSEQSVRPGREIPADEWQYRERSSAEVRMTLLATALEFVRGARRCPGVARISLLGSVVTHKPRPKDLIATPPVELWPEVLVRVDVPVDVEQLVLAPLRSDYTQP